MLLYSIEWKLKYVKGTDVANLAETTCNIGAEPRP